MRSPSMATGSPFSKSISMYVGSSGAFSGDTERSERVLAVLLPGILGRVTLVEMWRLASME